ncbi:MAG: hypothetical protein HZA52_10650 [Planctomycetes bacterium]|nr:hypothetical protein [Planctomycetota bacterium]
MLALRISACLTLGLLLATGANAGDLPAKQVAAPPADILNGVVRLPEPAALRTNSRALVRELAFARETSASLGIWSAEVPLAVDVAGELSIAWTAPDLREWRVKLCDARGGSVELDRASELGASERNGQVLDDVLPGWLVERRDFSNAPRGEWTLRFEVASEREPSVGLCVVRTVGRAELSTWVSTLSTVADERIAVLAELRDADRRFAHASGSVVFRSQSSVERVALADDGLHEDGVAGDGLFGALVPANFTGELRAEVELAASDAHSDTASDPANDSGRDSANRPATQATNRETSHAASSAPGARTRRSALLAFPVLERRIVLDGAVVASVHDPIRLRLELGAFVLAPAAKVQLSAEVWGSDARGEPVPICWLSRMVTPSGDAHATLSLFLDARWLELARALPPFELREVRVQDPDTHVVFDVRAALPLELGELPRVFGRGTSSVAKSMLTGPVVASSTSAGAHGLGTAHSTNRALVLAHGYCSGGSIWPAADFTTPKVEFLDPNQNRTHDQFALLMAQTGAPHDSFGVVAHSQGGAAALHLLTFYTSGLDFAFGPRRIQSLATPYQGTPLASLGQFACGVNNDMTTSGAPTWLAGIPTWARAEVYYWTTSNSGSVCNFLASLFLNDPEDGTTEQARGQLPGANSMGHTVGWCHTTGMSNPASYTDHARNQQMNAFAAR